MLQSFCCFLNATHMHLCYLNDANSCMDCNGKFFLRVLTRLLFVSPNSVRVDMQLYLKVCCGFFISSVHNI